MNVSICVATPALLDQKDLCDEILSFSVQEFFFNIEKKKGVIYIFSTNFHVDHRPFNSKMKDELIISLQKKKKPKDVD